MGGTEPCNLKVPRRRVKHGLDLPDSDSDDDRTQEYSPAKRSRHSPGPTPTPAPYSDIDDYPLRPRGPYSLIIHQVTCSQQGDHYEHPESASFEDQPRLFAGDSRASALRGRHELKDVDAYLDEHHDASFVVYRTYDCESYHTQVADKFERLHVHGLDPAAAARIRAYLSVLRKDGESARAISETMRILSPGMKVAVQLIARRSGERELFRGWDTDSALTAPYLYFYHTRKLMAQHASQIVNEGAATGGHIIQLLEYLDKHFCEEYSDADNLFAQGLVNHQHFPKLFAPNDIIVSSGGGHTMGYELRSCPQPGQTGVTLSCQTWDFDGQFRQREKQITATLPMHEADTKIRKLQFYPLRCDPQLEAKLRQRGEMFWKCRKRRIVSYDPPQNTLLSNPRYMVDASVYKQLHTKNEDGEEQQDSRNGVIDLDAPEPPHPNFVLLLPPTVRAFGFHDKKWRTLLVERIRDVAWNYEAFKQLVLDDDKKEIIQALVTVHLSSPITTDIIEGKGNALIILLHGAPGTGKTLTAESVAEYAKRPLYKVTCGDIGTDPEAVEKYLESVFYVASTWKAVLLLDESDVFLEERTQNDLQRNALVSVFLRALEYYDGILILTSNRVGLFDEAFKSRVQLALHYPPLDEDGRYNIWHNFVYALRDENGVDYADLDRKIRVFAQHNLNGRQIRNCITTARQIAKHKNTSLTPAHINKAIAVTEEFEAYVQKARGMDDREYQKNMGARAD